MADDYSDLGFKPLAQATNPHADLGFVPAPPTLAQRTADAAKGYGTSFGRGALQGMTAGFGDEIQGLMGAGAQFLGEHPMLQRLATGQLLTPESKLIFQPAVDEHGQPLPLADAYRAVRDADRQSNAAAEAAHPTTYLGGNVGGTVASMALVPGSASKSLATRLGALTGQGAASGLGTSSADLTSGGAQAAKRAAFDTGVGGILGLGAGAAGEGLTAGANAIASNLTGRGAAKIAAGQAKAAELGATKAAEATQAARSAAGQDAQALYRALEHVQNLKAAGTPEALAKLQQFEADGTIQSIQQRLLDKTLDELPGKLGKSQASRAAYQEALQTEPERAAQLVTEAEQPQIGKHALDLFKSYGEPVLGAVAGDLVGDQFGHSKLGAALGTAGGLIFGRTRAGKALANRLAKPGVQMALGRGLEKLGGFLSGAGNVGSTLGEGLGLSEPAMAGTESQLLAHPSLALALSGPAAAPSKEQTAREQAKKQQTMAALLRRRATP